MTHITPIVQPLLDYLRDEMDNHTLQYQSSPTLLQGGYANQLFLFQLTGSSDISSHKLVLRLLSPRAQVGQAYIEGTVQHVLHQMQFPTPPVFAICDDPMILGGAFIVMRYEIGELMLQAHPIEVCPEHLASIHLQRHRIAPQPVVTQLARRKIVRDWHTFIRGIIS
jgi:aminoglycoside phosphotransferase (APT) family kinase protein